MRKPHVFISSRLKLGVMRGQIKEILTTSGFSVEMYEADSTPSSEPATYLRDIIDADFVIFVLDESYGTPRDATGLSGVHEEWKRIRENRIPNHVYLRQSPGRKPERRQKEFINSELIAHEISYFYYDSPKRLLNQIRSSIVKMVLDIARSRSFRARLSPRTVVADLVERDHDTYCRWDRALVQLEEYERAVPERVTDGWGDLADLFQTFNPEMMWPFLDVKIQDLFAEVLLQCAALSQHDSTHTVEGTPSATIQFPDGPIALRVYRPIPPYPHDFFERRTDHKNKIFTKWRELGELVQRRYRRYADLG
jgi:hypothetical protein